MPGLEGAAPAMGAAVGGALKMEGGLGAAAGGLGKAAEIGNIGKIDIKAPVVPGLKFAEDLKVPLAETTLAGKLDSVSGADAPKNLLELARIGPIAPGQEGPVAGAIGLENFKPLDANKATVSPDTKNPIKTSAELAMERDTTTAQAFKAEKQASVSGSGQQPQTETAGQASQRDAVTAAQQGETGGNGARAAAENETATAQAETGQEAAVSKAPESDKTTSPENADKAKRAQELEGKIKNRTASGDEIKEHARLKQDPEQRRKDLEQKALDGTITDQEADELGSINAGESSKDLTPEQQAEKLNKDIEDLGTELITKMQKGEIPDQKDIDKFRDLWGKKTLMDQGFTSDQARAAMREAMARRGRGVGERQTWALKEVQAKIRELMSIELRIMEIPGNVRESRDKYNEARRDARNEAHKRNSLIAGSNQTVAEATALLQVAEYRNQIITLKYQVPVLRARERDLRAEIRRKTGVSSGWGAIGEWAAAKVNNAFTEISVNTQEELDYRSGNI